MPSEDAGGPHLGFRLGLRGRLLLLFAASMALVLAPVAAFQMQLVTRALEEQYRAHAVAIWHTLEAAYGAGAGARGLEVQEQIESLAGADPDLYHVAVYAVVDGQLRQVAGTEAGQVGRLAPDEARQVLATDEPRWHRHTDAGLSGRPSLLLYAPLRVADRPVAVAAINYGLAPLRALVEAELVAVLGIGGLGAVILLTVLYWQLDRTLLRRLSRLRRHAKAIATGQFTGQFGYMAAARGPGELGTLEEAFDQMARALQEQQAANEALQVELRQRWAEAERRAVTDLATGLYSHPYLHQRLAEETERALRAAEPLALLFCDLDDFRLVNEAYGHTNGDQVLVDVADLLQTCVRQIDVICRYGGEEFAVILPRADATGALRVAERIRATVAGHQFALAAPATPAGIPAHVPITLSIGIACYPSDADDAAGLVRAADRAVYRAKQLGRNQVRLYGELPPDFTLGTTPDTAEQASLHVVQSLAAAVDARDQYTGAHSESVAHYAALCARALGLSDDEVSAITMAGLLHDVGKIAIPDSILVKPGPLSESEWAKMREHPVKGQEIVGHIDALRGVVPLITHHHERYDGRGYPDGLAGEVIPLGARILAVADTFHAIASDRPYRPGRETAVALAELQRAAGTQLDATVVTAFRQAVTPAAVVAAAVAGSG